MTVEQAITILRTHNLWRRGADMPLGDTKEIGIAIDVLCDAVGHLPEQDTRGVQDIQSRLYEAAPILDDAGLDEVEHCCEWTLHQERKRVRPILKEAAEEISRLRAVDDLHARGRQAWADVPDASQWVDELRGGGEPKPRGRTT